jgi:O-antigen ligase
VGKKQRSRGVAKNRAAPAQTRPNVAAESRAQKVAAESRAQKVAAESRAPKVAAVLACAFLCLVLAGTALAVDTRAAAAFDSPKRLVAVLGTALAAACLLLSGRGPARSLRWNAIPVLSRWVAGFAAAALGLAAIAALASPRRIIALDTLRTIAVLSLLLPLGASRVFPKGRIACLAVFLGAAAVNAVVAVLEARRIWSPFELETFGGRQDTGAYAGNVGYLAIVLALAMVVALGILVSSGGRRARILAAAAVVVFGAGLLVNQNLTALTALLAGAAVLFVLRFRKRAFVPIGAAVLLVVVAVLAYAPLRQRAAELAGAARSGNWDAVVSFRGGPWAAALDMTRERPLLGFGPGTFGAEYVPHRLAAEIRAKRRFVSPLITSSYAESHSDYLQVATDAGIPAALLALGAAAGLLAAVSMAAWRRRDPETVVLAALLATAAAAALTWFPLQRPITAVPILLAAGRAWRVSAGDSGKAAEPEPVEDEA